MKRVTASEARRNWFRLLDEVAAGEVVIIERKGQRAVLRRESPTGSRKRLPDYSALISVEDADSADRWGWEWSAGEVGLRESGTDDGAS